MRVISGLLKGKNIKGYNLKGTRPTMDRTKMSLFDTIRPYLDNSIVLDLFAGSGSLGIESISNGAKHCYFIDYNSECIKTINYNLSNFNIKQKATVLNKDYTDALNQFSKENKKFDIIFLDPPYDLHIANEIIEFICNKNLLNDNGLIIVEIDKLYLNNEFQNLTLLKDKKYGTTYIYIYKKNE